MRYFKDHDGKVHGFDETDSGEAALMESMAIAQGWTEITGNWPPAETNAEKWAAYQAAAKSALEDTSTTVERIVEAVALGRTALTAQDVVTFMEYRAALRAILSEPQPATIPTELPTKPAYPANT